jgi:hypothetical protein
MNPAKRRSHSLRILKQSPFYLTQFVAKEKGISTMKFSSLAILAAFSTPVVAEIYLKEQFNDEVRHCESSARSHDWRAAWSFAAVACM